MQYAYYGLKCEDDDYVYTIAVPSVSFNGGMNMTFSCDFYYEKGYSGNLFCQKDSITFEVKNEYVCWMTANGGEVKSSALDAPLLEKAWNHVDVVYKESKLLLYVNRLKVDEAVLPKAGTASTDNYLIGQNYPGYIRNVRLADFAFDEEMIIAQSTRTTLDEEKLLLYIPFDETDAKDKGKYKQVVVCKGLARCVSLVSALTFETEGFAIIQNADFNPGNEVLPEFSIAIRVFLYPKNAENVVLFENQCGLAGAKDGFCVKLQMTTQKAYLAVELGGFSYQQSDIELAYFQWQAICITVKGKQINCYVNGILIKQMEMSSDYSRKSEAKWFLGNSSMEPEKSFRGAIDYFAVYKKALSEDGVRQIAEVEPYLYDEDICSLFLFHGESNQDLLGMSLLMHCNTAIKLLEETYAGKPVTKFAFRTNEVFSGNELEKWESDLVLELCGGITAAAAGTAMSQTIPACVEQALIKEITVMPETQKIFMEYDKIDAADMTDLFKKVWKKPKLKSLFSSSILAGGVEASAISILSNQKLMETEIILGSSIFAVFLAKIIAKILDKTKPKDPPYVPIPIPQIGYAVNLQTVQFFNGKNGSLPLRKNFKEGQSLPEWSAGSQKSEAVAYLAKKQTPTIEISFSYFPAKDQKSAVVSLKGKSDQFGNFETEKVVCNTAGVYKTKAILNEFQIKETTPLGQYQNTIKWSYNSVVGIDTFCGTIHTDVHILKNTPLEPWSVEDEAHYPTIELLELIGELQKQAGNRIENIKTFTEAFCEYLHTVKPAKFSAQDKYAAISDEDITEITFDNKKLTKAFLTGNQPLGSLDISAMCKYLAALEGMDTQILGFYGFEFPVDKNGILETASCGIWLKEVEAFGEDVTHKVIRHYVTGQVTDKDIGKMEIYDLVLERKNEKGYLYNICVEDYKKKVAGSADTMQPGFIGYNLVESDTVAALKISYNADEEKFCKTTRMAFKNYVKEKHYYPYNLACCHRLSYATMETILLDTFNKLKTDRNFFKEKKDEVIQYLWDAFYENEQFIENDEENREQLRECFEMLIECTKEDLDDEEKCNMVGNFLSDALYCLNSVAMNLKDGYVNWNASIGDGYDVGEHAFVFTCGGKKYQTGIEGDLQVVDSSVKSGLYPQEPEDIQILTAVKKIEKVLKKKYIFIYKSARNIECEGKRVYGYFIYSTRNEFEFVQGANRAAIATLVLE